MKHLILLLMALSMTSLAYADDKGGKDKDDDKGYEVKKSKSKDKYEDEDNGKDKDKHGTKALLARIEALEAALGYLGDTSNEVSGGSYLITSRGSQFFINNVAPVQGSGHSLGQVIYHFYGDGTGSTFVLSCEGRRFIDMDFNNEDTSIMESATFCQTQDVPFTYMQDGDQLSIQFAAFPAPLNYFVSDDGSMLVAANGGGSIIAPCVGDNAPDGCTVTVSTVVVNQGMRIGDSE